MRFIVISVQLLALTAAQTAALMVLTLYWTGRIPL